MNKPKLGATGDYPEGRLNEDDEGALNMAIGYDHKKDVVFIEFGSPVKWFAMSPAQAIEMANHLIKHARRG